LNFALLEFTHDFFRNRVTGFEREGHTRPDTDGTIGINRKYGVWFV
jgi:hypothetical protein